MEGLSSLPWENSMIAKVPTTWERGKRDEEEEEDSSETIGESD